MIPDHNAARQAIQKARQALQQGKKQAARRWAEQAAALAPDMEEPWLILGSVASPKASVAYLQQALQINPHSETARKGLQWALERLQKVEDDQAAGLPYNQSMETNQPGAPPSRQRRSPSAGRKPRESTPVQPPVIQERALTTHRHSILPLILLVACLTMAWAIWPGNAQPALAFIRQNVIAPLATSTQPGTTANLPKPTYTPTSTATATSTPTLTPSPTPTETSTPEPTYTPLPTSEADNAIPYIPVAAGERWIDVDLSLQRVYAYEGNTLVNSFIVSTGTWLHPTITGQYHVYIKLLYSNMSGPGYYLPDVPYTMYFYKGYALHGTYWHNNFGTPMSHGCINLTIADAGWLYNFASVGTLVNIHY